MATYNSLPFEIHDTILSALCRYGTYRDVLGYGATSKYHHELMKQNSDFQRMKTYSRVVCIKYKKTSDNRRQITAVISTGRPLHFLNGLWMENRRGQLIQAEFFGNQFCLERLKCPIIAAGEWIPFGFSRYHGFYGFPMGSLAYVQLRVILTFDKPQTDEFKLYAYGQEVLSREAYVKLFRPYELWYPIDLDVFSRLEEADSKLVSQRARDESVTKIWMMAFFGGSFSCISEEAPFPLPVLHKVSWWDKVQKLFSGMKMI